tara:strand:+ start:408 stop:524 length:117 start_codon:yes stop_codon:yes gene_type:complete
MLAVVEVLVINQVLQPLQEGLAVLEEVVLLVYGIKLVK